MKLSQTISLSLLDEEGNTIQAQTPVDQTVEMIIPRDPSFRLPPMSLQNVTSIKNDSFDRCLFNLHWIDFISDVIVCSSCRSSSSVEQSFLFDDFDRSPILNSSLSHIDDWSLFCPSVNDSLYTNFFSNNQTFGHRSLIFALRQLNSADFCAALPLIPPFTNERFHFTENYELRLYTSSCFDFDEKTEE